MKNLLVVILRKLLLIIIMMMITIVQTACQAKKYPKGIEHIVVIGLDGMSSTGFHAATTPCMDSLIQHGAVSYTVRCVLPTASTANWNAMLCGAGPEITGATNNSWKVNDFDFPPTAISKDRSFPNIFRILRMQKPKAELGAIYHWDGFSGMLEESIMNLSQHCSTQLETAQKSADYIIAKKPTFLFIQLDGIDSTGHHNGHMSPEYVQYIGETDSHVRLVVEAINKAGILGSTMIMIVSDHGGIFGGHGGNTYDELTTPIIFAGKGIKRNYRIRQQIYKYDVAADVAFAFGVKAPQLWTGRPTLPAYTGFNEPDNLWEEMETLPSPRFAATDYKAPFGGEFTNRATVTIIAPEGTKGIIRYTIDGSTPTIRSTAYTTPFTVEKTTVVNAKLFNEKGESIQVSATYKVTKE
jgi:hypothetical protein